MFGSSLGQALRSLSGRPRLALAAVTCVALGVAATQSVATLVNAALLRRLVAAGGARPLVLGTLVGLAGALLRSAAKLLYGIGPLDPASFALGAGVLLLVAALAAVLPARRATSVDPMVALRSE